MWLDSWSNRIYRVCILKRIDINKKEVIQIVKRIETKQIKIYNITWFAIKSRINQQIKRKKTIWLRLEKSIQMNNYLIFYLFTLNSAKNMSKWVKNEQKCPKITNIWHILTFKKVFILYAKRIGWPVFTQFWYQISKRILNIFE